MVVQTEYTLEITHATKLCCSLQIQMFGHPAAVHLSSADSLIWSQDISVSLQQTHYHINITPVFTNMF